MMSRTAVWCWETSRALERASGGIHGSVLAALGTHPPRGVSQHGRVVLVVHSLETIMLTAVAIGHRPASHECLTTSMSKTLLLVTPCRRPHGQVFEGCRRRVHRPLACAGRTRCSPPDRTRALHHRSAGMSSAWKTITSTRPTTLTRGCFRPPMVGCARCGSEPAPREGRAVAKLATGAASIEWPAGLVTARFRTSRWRRRGVLAWRRRRM